MADHVDIPDDDTPRRHSYDGPQIAIEDELKTSYLDYAMSVIVSRAIPDLRDGLKPVHRRILYAMHESGNSHDRPYRKSARPVGDVMGKYHPHGDAAIYDALVRMAQPFSMSMPLLDGQGNFGSVDGDNPAAMRYTEVRMDRPADFLLADIGEDTVDFQDNYDGKDQEPVVLPSRFPNMLVNGASGIAVGMATNIPPHNLGEVIDATLALIEDPDLDSIQIAVRYLPAPDFPTGGVILGTGGARRAYTTGKGIVIMRARSRIEEGGKDGPSIIVSEIPYQVNKSALVEKISELSRDKSIEGITGVHDESDRSGMRIVIGLRRDATPEVVLNQLYRQTPMQTSFGCNMLALNSGRPELLDLRSFLTAFIDFRNEVVIRRTSFQLRKARERSHLLCGLAVAVANVDEVVSLIRSSASPAEARDRLLSRHWSVESIVEYIRLIDDPTQTIQDDGTYQLTLTQVRAILDLRLHRLTAMGVRDIGEELGVLAKKMLGFLEILQSREKILAIISDELRDVKEKFAHPRRTEIVEEIADLDDDDLIEREDVVVTVTNAGYIKRSLLSEYREQKRGGKGLRGAGTKDADFVTSVFVTDTHTSLLFFSTTGMVYRLKTWRLPPGGRNSRGKAIVNILPIPQGVSIAAIMPEDAGPNRGVIVFATQKGRIKRNAISDFHNIQSNGKIGIGLKDGDSLIGISAASEDDDVLLTTALGRAIRFTVDSFRLFVGRKASGVRGIRLRDGDSVVSMAIIRHTDVSVEERRAYARLRRDELKSEIPPDAAESPFVDDATSEPEQNSPEIQLDKRRYEELIESEEFILTITAKGFGKRTSSYEYRLTARGGQGLIAANLKLRDDRIVAAFAVEDSDRIMLVTSKGQSIRCPVSDIRKMGRASSGVRVFNVADEEDVVSVARIAEPDDGDEQTCVSEDVGGPADGIKSTPD
ncbi:MAG: DNA gyrase subunit A [Paracoccaceae bacterium]|nr:DNA gyrase subunit A [Paracoccaceae bacterium]MDE2915223.1 DNA gyrase subunit A [Paracoccaceae bacterium]